MRHSLFAAFCFLLAACGGDKYPFPPQFVDATMVSDHVLAAPPAPGSVDFNREIDSIIARQHLLSAKQKDVLVAENHIAPEMIVLPVLGKRYTRESYPALYTLLRHAASDAWRIADANQDYWQSPRPWVADARVQLLVPKITRPGYPSGHTTTNTVWAYVLSELFPAKRATLFARADAIGFHRVDGGAHFPHDVAGGKQLAAIIYAAMKTNPQFKKELAEAKAELASPAVKHGNLPECAVTPRPDACH